MNNIKNKYKNMSFRIKNIMIYAITTILCTGLLLFFINKSLATLTQSQIKEMGNVIANDFTSNLEVSNNYQETLEKFFEKNKKSIEIISIVETKEYTIKAHLAKDRIGKVCSDPGFMEDVKNKKELYGQFEHVKQTGNDLYVIMFPFIKDGEVKYIINMGIKINNYLSISHKLFLTILVSMLMYVLISCLTGWFSSKNLDDAIKDIIAESEKVKNKNLILNKKEYKLIEAKNMSFAFNNVIKFIKDFINKFKSNYSGFEKTSNELLNNVQDISQETGVINNKSKNISTVLENLSATIEEILASTEEIKAVTESLNEKAQDSSKKSDHIKQSAIISKEKLIKTTEEINKIYEEKRNQALEYISKSSKINQIKDISNVLNDINSKINLLALNAAIEAARAGETGRGFAVVADEIGKLSSNTEITLKEINPVIDEITEVVALLGETSQDILNFINEKITKDNEVLTKVNDNYIKNSTDISEAVSEIKCISEDINSAISQIQLAVNDFAGKVQETYADTEELNNSLSQINNKTKEIKDKFKSYIKSIKDFNENLNEFIL